MKSFAFYAEIYCYSCNSWISAKNIDAMNANPKVIRAIGFNNKVADLINLFPIIIQQNGICVTQYNKSIPAHIFALGSSGLPLSTRKERTWSFMWGSFILNLSWLCYFPFKCSRFRYWNCTIWLFEHSKTQGSSYVSLCDRKPTSNLRFPFYREYRTHNLVIGQGRIL